MLLPHLLCDSLTLSPQRLQSWFFTSLVLYTINCMKILCMYLDYQEIFFHNFDVSIAQLPCLVFEQRISEQSCLNTLELQQNDFRVLFLTLKTNCEIKLYFKLDLYVTVGVHTKSIKWCNLRRKHRVFIQHQSISSVQHSQN